MSRLYGPIAQICYLAEDLPSALVHWTETVGIGPFFILPKRVFAEYIYRGERTDDSDIIAAVALAYSGDLQIEIIVPGPSPSSYREFLDRGNSGAHHFGFASHDFDGERAAGIAVGMSIVMEGASPLARFAYMEGDPAWPGTIVELIEMNPRIDAVFASIKAASMGWDGNDPIRYL